MLAPVFNWTVGPILVVDREGRTEEAVRWSDKLLARLETPTWTNSPLFRCMVDSLLATLVMVGATVEDIVTMKCLNAENLVLGIVYRTELKYPNVGGMGR